MDYRSSVGISDSSSGSELSRRFETGTLDEMKSCPYNPHHVMKASRFQIHLVNCRKQHPEKAAKMFICQYNQTHHVLETDREKHLVICPQYHHYNRERAKAAARARDREQQANSARAARPQERGRSPSPPPTLQEQQYVLDWL